MWRPTGGGLLPFWLGCIAGITPWLAIFSILVTLSLSAFRETDQDRAAGFREDDLIVYLHAVLPGARDRMLDARGVGRLGGVEHRNDAPVEGPSARGGLVIGHGEDRADRTVLRDEARGEARRGQVEDGGCADLPRHDHTARRSSGALS